MTVTLISIPYLTKIRFEEGSYIGYWLDTKKAK